MKTKSVLLAASILAALALSLPQAMGATITDTTGDLNDGTVGDDLSGFGHLDITSVEVTNSFTDLIWKINLVGDPVAVNWGKYCIGISTNNTTGSTTNNGWGRPISLGIGMDFWIGSWVDGGNGIELYSYDGANFNNIGGATITKDTSSVTIRAGLDTFGKGVGDSIDFEVYTTAGGGTDSAVDALSDPSVAITTWSGPYSSNLFSTYSIVAIPATTNQVTFQVDMGVPIWELDNSIPGTFGFDPNVDTVYVTGSFNGWGTPPTPTNDFKLLQVGSTTVFSNTVPVVAPIGDSVFYKFWTDIGEWENPVLLGGGDRELVVTGAVATAPTVGFSDRLLTNPATNTVTFCVDMSFQQTWGEFEPTSGHTVVLPGQLQGWNPDTEAILLTNKPAPDTNIYCGSLELFYYPTGIVGLGDYKAKINGNTNARDGGWERPISTGSGNRSFDLLTVNPTYEFDFNDEDGVFDIDSISEGSIDLTFDAYYEGVYDIQSREDLNSGSYSTIGTVTNKTKDFQAVTFSDTALTNREFYRVEFKGYDKPPLP
jgi:hypothetical protein